MPRTAPKMPKFTPAPERIVRLFHQNVDGLPGVELRIMFSYPCAFLRGQMLAGVFADRIMLRLSETDREEYIRVKKGKLFEPAAGRPMHEYVELTEQVTASPAEFRKWLEKGLAYVSTLPPKVRKARRKT